MVRIPPVVGQKWSKLFLMFKFSRVPPPKTRSYLLRSCTSTVKLLALLATTQCKSSCSVESFVTAVHIPTPVTQTTALSWPSRWPLLGAYNPQGHSQRIQHALELEVENLGVQRILTSPEQTVYYAKISGILQNSKLDSSAVECERVVILCEQPEVNKQLLGEVFSDQNQHPVHFFSFPPSHHVNHTSIVTTFSVGNQGTPRLGAPALFASFARPLNGTPGPLFPTVVADFQSFPDGRITSSLWKPWRYK